MPKPIYKEAKYSQKYSTCNQEIEEMIRVNHAGEYGATFIYRGQLDGCDKKHKSLIREMLDQETEHMKIFEKYMLENKIRPSALLFLWKKIGYYFGYFSAKKSIKCAMISTESIESVIENHYENQISYLKNKNQHQELRNIIKKIQQEEIDHKNTCSEYSNTKQNILDKVFYDFVSGFCKIAIFLSKKI